MKKLVVKVLIISALGFIFLAQSPTDDSAGRIPWDEPRPMSTLLF
ncbi:hypothetical protein [Evansella tamaricis]|nr:hypothetical protein [Evansella tamaricis]